MGILKKILVVVLTWQSRLIIRKYKPFIVAITGSVGKTSTKDAIFCVLKSPMICNDQDLCYVRKSEKSMNSDIGLPLSIIGVPNAWNSLSGWINNIIIGFGLIFRHKDYPDCLVLEVGADHPGDIKKVAYWLKPNITVITRISRTPVHVEFFSSPEQVFEEKMHLAKAVKDKGIVVLYADDEKTLSIKEEVEKDGKSVITYGLSKNAQVRGTEETIIYEEINGLKSPVGFSFNLDMKSRVLPVTVKGGLGRPYIYTLLAAAAVGQARGMTEESIGKALHEYDVSPGRMNIISGINDSTLIDDTYNSSPDAAISALETLKSIETSGNKIAVLADMMELGKHAGDEHRKIGRKAVSIVSRLVTVGQRSRITAEEAVKNSLSVDKVNSFDTAEQAAEFLLPLVKADDVVLIKGSQSMRMEKVTKALLREPENANKLLVRQEKEWLIKV